MAGRASRYDAASMGFRHPLIEPAGSFAYVECTIPAGMTISTYRRGRARLVERDLEHLSIVHGREDTPG